MNLTITRRCVPCGLESMTNAQTLSNKALAYCQNNRFERGMICAAWLQGEAALGLGELVNGR